MRRFLLLLLTLSIFARVNSQSASNSRATSYYTFVYRITNEEVIPLFENRKHTLSPNYFHNLIDYYPTDSVYRKKLPVGHYLFTKANADFLETELQSFNNLELNVLDNSRDLLIVFTDSLGNEIKGLKPKVSSKQIFSDEKLNAYRISKTNKQGLVKVEYNGHLNFFEIQRRYNNTIPARTKRRVIHTFPINILISPFTYTYRSVKGLIKYGNLYPPRIYYRAKRLFEPKTFAGYLVLNKPMFKPSDTVRLKAFVTSRKGRPLKRDLNVYLRNYATNTRKFLGSINPYRDGAYRFEFVLNDSLKLSLDSEYAIYLEDRHDNYFPNKSFSYEEYELNQNFFTLKASPENKEDAPAAVLLKGTDSNELPLYDVNTQLLVKPKKVIEFHESRLFIADTLWNHTTKLEPLGDTRIDFPDSIYPNALLEYEVIATFTNAQNERQVKTLSLTYNSIKQGTIKCENDSVVFQFHQPGLFQIVGLNKEGVRLFNKNVSLPYTIKLQPAAALYELRDGSTLIKQLKMSSEQSLINLLAEHSKDSLFISLQNPRKLDLRYQVFKNNRIINEGYSDKLNYRVKALANDRYYVSIQYLWAGNSQAENFDLPFAKKPLSIEIDESPTVFPGEAREISITVNDAFGKPVNNVDLTAYAVTKKFGESYRPDAAPSFERFKNRKAFNSFSEKEIAAKRILRKLQYDFWKQTLGLDSIGYYHFLYPQTGIFTEYTLAEDSITQVAPYVVSDGAVLSVYYIKFDEELKYYYEVASIEPYSFCVTKPVKKITIRLRDRLVELTDVKVNPGTKLVLSVDINNLPSNVSVIKMAPKLSESEIQRIKPHFMWISRDINQSKAFLRQGNTYRVLKPFQYNYGYSGEMVGPFFPGTLEFQTHFNQSFSFKPLMTYTFKPGLVDREPKIYSFEKRLPAISFRASLKDQVQTEARIREYWNDQKETISYRFIKYPSEDKADKYFGSLSLRIKRLRQPDKTRLATFILNLDHPDEFYIFPPGTDDFSPLKPGLYQCVVIYSDESYLNPKPVRILPYGTMLCDLTDEKLLPPDSFSHEVLEKIREWSSKNAFVEQYRMQEMQSIRQLYYRESIDVSNYTGGRWVTGIVTSTEDGSALPGVNVIVQGTTIGTVSDADGFYRIYVPYNANLIFSFIGLTTTELNAGSRSVADIQLTADVQQLSEVVVTAYGVTTERRAMAYSVSTVSGAFQGRIAGLQVEGSAGSSDSYSIRLRGAASLNGNQKPLIVIDGLLKNFDDINFDDITAMEILKSESAVALYGSRAANGVILISTKSGTSREQLLQTKLPDTAQFISLQDSSPGSSLRKNFRDYAFWQPALRTDRYGKATFNVTYPDDVTGWNIHALGMASHKRTGEARKQIQSFKPLLAQLALPNFLIAGDTAQAIAKITNYSPDSVSLTQTLSINDENIRSEKVRLKNSRIDSVQLVGLGDSLTVKYEIEYNKYKDGELRTIHVLPVGTLETKGIFAALPTDTTFVITANRNSTLTLFAQADVTDVILDEIQLLKAYPFECNEQVASKLKALLAEKTICDYKKKKFEHDRWIEKSIKKLISNQSVEGSWSWWGEEGESMWISIHVAEALRWAEKMGYKTTFDKNGLKNFMMYPPNDVSEADRLRAWIFLSEAGEKISEISKTDSILKDKVASNYYKLIAMRLSQLQGSEPDWKWIESQKHKTLKGNVYWGEEKVRFWDNDTDNTLLVYKMLINNQADHPDLLRIKNYFLEKRRRGWRNTYESAKIIEAILPSLKAKPAASQPVLTLNGDINLIVKSFPFENKVSGISELTISKTGTDPIYFSAYEEIWNPDPTKTGVDFKVNTHWANNNSILKAGSPAILKTEVEVARDAEYVMIRIPIPAGCSYSQKIQSRINGEVHREHDIHEVRIYCESLKAGKYEYSVDLLPRYKGNYTINPAKAEWMYFPAIYGREGIKKIIIE